MNAIESYESKFKSFVENHGVSGVCMQLDASCHSAVSAAETLSVSISDIVKNICCITDDGRTVIITLQGEDKVSLNKVKEALAVHKVRIATQEEVLSNTGYPCGGVPSFGYDALFLIDTKVLERTFVYTGGGGEFSLFKTTPQELARVSGARIIDVRK